MGRTDKDRGQRIRHGRSAPTQRERLIKPLVKELNGPLPGNASSLGVILRAILLEEPMFGPRIRIEGDLPPRSLERLLHLRDRPPDVSHRVGARTALPPRCRRAPAPNRDPAPRPTPALPRPTRSSCRGRGRGRAPRSLPPRVGRRPAETAPSVPTTHAGLIHLVRCHARELPDRR